MFTAKKNSIYEMAKTLKNIRRRKDKNLLTLSIWQVCLYVEGMNGIP